MQGCPHILFAVSCTDYHDIEIMADQIKLPKKVKSVEAPTLGEDRNYWGVLYCGRKPSKHDIEKALIDGGYRPMKDEDRGW